VGRLVERKGVHVLLDALARLPAVPRVRLEVVGEGSERPALESQAAALGLSDRVKFHGFVSDAELASHLEAADCLVLPAVTDAKGDVEGLGVVLLEAMSFGRPVIASAAGGIVDVVRSGETGLLVPPGDVAALASAIARFAADPGEVERMGAEARQDVRARFSWDTIVDSLVALYRRVARAETS
jgi:glycosyltransferase involved in cell wall biosynthesis